MMADPTPTADQTRSAPIEAPATRFGLLEAAVRTGQATSDALAKQFGTGDPWRLVEALNVSLDMRGRCADQICLRSELLGDPPVIVLYLETLAQLSRLIVLRAPRLAYAPLDTIAVAVELFHYLDRRRPELVKGLTIGWPRVAREVAAHAFAQDLLELPFFPAEIDAVERLSRAPRVGVKHT